MKRSVLLATMLLVVSSLFSQYKPYYNVAIGFRAGSEAATCGLTGKVFVGKASALEAIVGYANSGLAGTILFEQHLSLFRRKEFQGYFGGGMHYTSKSGYGNYVELSTRNLIYQDGKAAYGCDAVFGLEYKFTAVPIAVSVDLKPFFEVNQLGSYYKGIDKSIGIKFAF
jgi:hypothetical protein